MQTLIVSTLFVLAKICHGDFYYPNFNDTNGLVMIGNAGTTNCHNSSALDYGDVQYKADLFNEPSEPILSESSAFVSEITVITNTGDDQIVDNTLAGFLNRNSTSSSGSYCSERVRLTPSNPSKKGALWHRDVHPVSSGFETYFSFQITDPSRECTTVKDSLFSTTHYRTCNIRGADGFAFVIQNSASGTSSIGKDGGQLGFGGIDNSLAIAFDTWTNPGLNEDTMLIDRVSVQSLSEAPNNAFQTGLLGMPKPHTLADGNVHTARITYYNHIRYEYLRYYTASESLVAYLKSNGDRKQIGTLLVYLDDGIGLDAPLIAIPINLSLLLNMPDDVAYVGFTSSTGRFYEKHDVLSWLFCDVPPCYPRT